MTRIPPVRRLLMDAKALIAKPSNWCKRAFAETARGKQINSFSPEACRFCAHSAIHRASRELTLGIQERAICLATRFTPNRSIILFNDAPETTHLKVMRLFNQAIRRAKEQGI